ncbi:MAG: hypothetical protein U1E52_04840 [Geminicoccaceae bacterium]
MTSGGSGRKAPSTGSGGEPEARKGGDQGREGFWGKGHQGVGFHRDERRAHSREDYGRAGYDETGKSTDDDDSRGATDSGGPRE